MAEKTIQEQLGESVKQLSNLSEAELELELGRRLSQTKDEIDQQSTLSMALPQADSTVDTETLMALPDFVRKAAQRFWEKFNRQMYSLVCDADDQDNQKLRKAAATSIESLALVVSGMLVATFGWLPGIASVLAVMIAKRFANSAYDAVCSTWKEQLPD